MKLPIQRNEMPGLKMGFARVTLIGVSFFGAPRAGQAPAATNRRHISAPNHTRKGFMAVPLR